jgi:hypothetical protein
MVWGQNMWLTMIADFLIGVITVVVGIAVGIVLVLMAIASICACLINKDDKE